MLKKNQGDPPSLKAGPEMDAAVAVEVFGAQLLGGVICSWPPGCGAFRGVPAYSTDIAAAWLVVEKMRAEGWELLLESSGFEQSVWVATWSHIGEPWGQESYRGQTAPGAICAAALAAARAGKDGK